jgi:hypothetical protein
MRLEERPARWANPNLLVHRVVLAHQRNRRIGRGADGGQFDDMVHIGASGVREHAPMLRYCVWTVPAREQHHVDSIECADERCVIVEAALHNLGATEPTGAGGLAHERADRRPSRDQGVYRRSSDLARCSGDQNHGRDAITPDKRFRRQANSSTMFGFDALVNRIGD